MNTPQSRLPQLLQLVPGPQAVPLLASRIRGAAADPMVVLAPVPQVSAHVSEAMRAALIAAVAPDCAVVDNDVQLILTTSGSTGSPKGVMHSFESVAHAAGALHDRLGGPGDWLCALPLHTSAGFMTVARAALAGTAAVPVDSLGGAEPFTPEAFLRGCERMSQSLRRYVSLVPAMAQRLADDAAALAALSRFSAVVIGGQAIPSALTGRLRDAGVTVVLSYGGTETCGGCVYDGTPLAGVDIGITDDGRVRITGPVVMRGYREPQHPTGAESGGEAAQVIGSDAVAGSERVSAPMSRGMPDSEREHAARPPSPAPADVNRSLKSYAASSREDSSHWAADGSALNPPGSRTGASAQTAVRSIVMPDFGVIDAAGSLRILGRSDDIAVVNGVNVSVTAVESMLHGLGVSAVVCAVDDRVYAVTPVGIAPDESDAATARAKEHFGIRLSFRVVRDIPLTAAGKPDRAALAMRAAEE